MRVPYDLSVKNQILSYENFDSLLKNDLPFALYRLPGSEITLMVQSSSSYVNKFYSLQELNNKKGFVIAPFLITDDKPVVVIRPDVYLKDEKEIFEYLVLSNKYPIEATPSPALSGGQYLRNSTDINKAHKIYQEKFNLFHQSLQQGEFQKLVLSRFCDYQNNSQSIGNLFKKACDAYPGNFVYVCHTRETGTWFGISPELLLSERNGKYKTVALAGTQEKDKDWDDKNKNEQQIVVDYMQLQLQKGGYCFTQEETKTVQSGNLYHLVTEFSFDAKQNSGIGDLLHLLHPTPAICGLPEQETFDFIVENEGYDRRYYSGFIGPLQQEARSNLYVNLRCMECFPGSLRLYAGGGILLSSKVSVEWEETEKKMQTILNLVQEI